jgi:hypothetical protein
MAEPTLFPDEGTPEETVPAAKPAFGERARLALKKIEDAKAGRRGAFDAVKADAEAAKEAIEPHVRAIWSQFDYPAWETDNPDHAVFSEVETLAQSVLHSDSARDRLDLLRELQDKIVEAQAVDYYGTANDPDFSQADADVIQASLVKMQEECKAGIDAIKTYGKHLREMKQIKRGYKEGGEVEGPVPYAGGGDVTESSTGFLSSPRARLEDAARSQGYEEEDIDGLGTDDLRAAFGSSLKTWESRAPSEKDLATTIDARGGIHLGELYERHANVAKEEINEAVESLLANNPDKYSYEFVSSRTKGEWSDDEWNTLPRVGAIPDVSFGSTASAIVSKKATDTQLQQVATTRGKYNKDLEFQRVQHVYGMGGKIASAAKSVGHAVTHPVETAKKWGPIGAASYGLSTASMAASVAAGIDIAGVPPWIPSPVIAYGLSKLTGGKKQPNPAAVGKSVNEGQSLQEAAKGHYAEGGEIALQPGDHVLREKAVKALGGPGAVQDGLGAKIVPGPSEGDTVPATVEGGGKAMLEGQEAVVPKETAQAIGKTGMDRLNKADQTFADGGSVGESAYAETRVAPHTPLHHQETPAPGVTPRDYSQGWVHQPRPAAKPQTAVLTPEQTDQQDAWLRRVEQDVNERAEKRRKELGSGAEGWIEQTREKELARARAQAMHRFQKYQKEAGQLQGEIAPWVYGKGGEVQKHEGGEAITEPAAAKQKDEPLPSKSLTPGDRAFLKRKREELREQVEDEHRRHPDFEHQTRQADISAAARSFALKQVGITPLEEMHPAMREFMTGKEGEKRKRSNQEVLQFIAEQDEAVVPKWDLFASENEELFETAGYEPTYEEMEERTSKASAEAFRYLTNPVEHPKIDKKAVRAEADRRANEALRSLKQPSKVTEEAIENEANEEPDEWAMPQPAAKSDSFDFPEPAAQPPQAERMPANAMKLALATPADEPAPAAVPASSPVKAAKKTHLAPPHAMGFLAKMWGGLAKQTQLADSGEPMPMPAADETAAQSTGDEAGPDTKVESEPSTSQRPKKPPTAKRAGPIPKKPKPLEGAAMRFFRGLTGFSGETFWQKKAKHEEQTKKYEDYQSLKDSAPMAAAVAGPAGPQPDAGGPGPAALPASSPTGPLGATPGKETDLSAKLDKLISAIEKLTDKMDRGQQGGHPVQERQAPQTQMPPPRSPLPIAAGGGAMVGRRIRG